jgi:phage terminase large subunit GpA-like protein
VDLSFVWTADGDPQFGAVWHCPHCGEKQQVEAMGRVVHATKTEPYR